ncbi:AraC family transcriptional regulator [Sphingomonas sp.]|uniref:AraC family transcriptional regulator n=1 Tax=Sphingomonas sp. TaxID=28214 RepID=UPI000DB18068|nr:AraC family transcriptional regulator [Sphingomonas sp.]PZU10978.1 MAG: hypothetical protein DI605_05065 [Sphingomonas sp.]
MDLLSEFLTKFRIDGSSIGSFLFSDPWGLEMAGGAFLYVVTQGDCLLLVPGSSPQKLEVGDSVLSLGGARVVLASRPDAEILGIKDLWRRTRSPKTPKDGYHRPIRLCWGGGGRDCRLFTLVAAVPADATAQAILRALPDVIVQKRTDTDLLSWISRIDGFGMAESMEERPGFIALATALSRFILMSLVRAFVLTSSLSTLDLIRSPGTEGIARSLKAIRMRPLDSWSVKRLAREAGMSRTCFCDAFRRIVGHTPMTFVRNQRMETAAVLLAEGGQSVAEIGVQLGYASEKAFRGAFVRSRGVSPSAYRRAVRAG